MTDRKSPPPLGPHSAPPSKLDDEYIRRKLDSISHACAKQATIEAERTGASKNTSRLIAIFGTLITAGALGGFGWIWQMSVTTNQHEAAIHRLAERANDHDPAPPGHDDLEIAIRNNERRVDAAEGVTKQINSRLDRLEHEGGERHREVLEELRRLRSTRRSWGN